MISSAQAKDSMASMILSSSLNVGMMALIFIPKLVQQRYYFIIFSIKNLINKKMRFYITF